MSTTFTPWKKNIFAADIDLKLGRDADKNFRATSKAELLTTSLECPCIRYAITENPQEFLGENLPGQNLNFNVYTFFKKVLQHHRVIKNRSEMILYMLCSQKVIMRDAQQYFLWIQCPERIIGRRGPRISVGLWVIQR